MGNKKAAVNVQRSRKKQIKNFFLAQFCQLGMKVLNRLTLRTVRIPTWTVPLGKTELGNSDEIKQIARNQSIAATDFSKILEHIPSESCSVTGGFVLNFYVLSQEQYNTLMSAFQRMEKKIEGVAENPLKHERKPLPETKNPGPTGRGQIQGESAERIIYDDLNTRFYGQHASERSMWRVEWGAAVLSLSPEQRTAAQIGAERHEQIARMIEEQNELTLNEFARRFLVNNTHLGIDPAQVPNAVEGSFTEEEETPDDES